MMAKKGVKEERQGIENSHFFMSDFRINSTGRANICKEEIAWL